MNTKLLIPAILIAIMIAVSACETPQPHRYTPIKAPPQPTTMTNPDCEEVSQFRVFQVLDDFALANACEATSHGDFITCFGHTVYLPREPGKIYYDDQIIKSPPGKCVVYVGTHQYETARGYKTVPVVKFVDARIPIPPEKKDTPQ
jgi:hypothetical protein